MATDQQSAHHRPVQAPSARTRGSTLDNIRAMLEAGRVEKALQLANKNESDHELRNASGVCHMRLRHADKAVKIYRSLVLVLVLGGLDLKSDVPEKMRINFATALLLTGHVAGCLSIIRELNDDENPAVQRLSQAINDWE